MPEYLNLWQRSAGCPNIPGSASTSLAQDKNLQDISFLILIGCFATLEV